MHELRYPRLDRKRSASREDLAVLTIELVGILRSAARCAKLSSYPDKELAEPSEVNDDDERCDAWYDMGHGDYLLLAIVVLILIAAALIRYLRS